ncbi:MAG: metal-dependent hydrolase [Pseudomonadales bacterium]
MDPITQGTLGATAAQCGATSKNTAVTGTLGFVAGMAADLDVLIRSNSDPLLFLEYHRQFTHSLIFIPVGGLLCGLLLYYLYAKRRQFSLLQTIAACMLGYATHALLDACTTYGTMLFWPFSELRVAWNVISIVDPLYTPPILLLVVLAGMRKNPNYARLALVWALLYPLLGLVQRERAVDAGWELAQSRGHDPISLEAKPSFANIALWKIVYEVDQHYYIDAVRVDATTRYFPGEHVAKLDVARDFPWLDLDSQQAEDIERFRWFSNGYIAIDQNNPRRIIDVRYSMIPNQVASLWSIELSANARPDEHARYLTHRNGARANVRILLEMILN